MVIALARFPAVPYTPGMKRAGESRSPSRQSPRRKSPQSGQRDRAAGTRQKPASPGGVRKGRARTGAAPAPPTATTAVPAELAAPAEALPPPALAVPPALTEEEQIEAAKYLPRDLPPRVFEEERFLFPESYGVNRVRLLVKDPEWLFAHWDVDPRTFDSLRGELGERASALTRLTLRVWDPGNGGATLILLPYGARSWYVRADRAPRSYRAQLGVTLPSGEFRVLAESNTVATPRVGPSSVKARRVVRHDRLGELPSLAALDSDAEEVRSTLGPGPWSAPPQEGLLAGGPLRASDRTEPSTSNRGGASDLYRR